MTPLQSGFVVAVAGLLLVASRVSADDEAKQVEAVIDALIAVYDASDANPAKGRELLRKLCDNLGGLYREESDDERRDVWCRMVDYELGASFSRHNGKIVSTGTWFAPYTWASKKATIEAADKKMRTFSITTRRAHIWRGKKDKAGWWPELGMTSPHRGGILLVYGWTNKRD